MARSLGWHSRSKVTPYFLQASSTGPKRSTSSSRLTSRTSGMAWPSMLDGSGGNRKKWLQQWAGEPTKPGTRHLAVLQLAEDSGPAARRRAGLWRACSWISLPTSSGHEIGIGARRLVALVAPGLVGRTGLAADELQRLGARLVAQRLALQMRGDGEDFQAVLLGQVDALLGIGLGAGVGVALAQVEFPAGFFPAVEAGVLHELHPFVHRHVAELAANQADLMIRALAEAMCRTFA